MKCGVCEIPMWMKYGIRENGVLPSVFYRFHTSKRFVIISLIQFDATLYYHHLHRIPRVARVTLILSRVDPKENKHFDSQLRRWEPAAKPSVQQNQSQLCSKTWSQLCSQLWNQVQSAALPKRLCRLFISKSNDDQSLESRRTDRSRRFMNDKLYWNLSWLKGSPAPLCGGPRWARSRPRSATRQTPSQAESKGSIGEGPNHLNYSDRSSVRILSKFKNFL